MPNFPIRIVLKYAITVGLILFSLGMLGDRHTAKTFAQGFRQEIDRDSLVPMVRQITVRILVDDASGSGVIINRQGSVYTLLTNWHVVAFSSRPIILTVDGQRHVSREPPQKLGNQDLALVKFESLRSYRVARISPNLAQIGEPVLAVGFPMYESGSRTTTFHRGIQGLRMTVGEVSLLPEQSLERGYSLGYTNSIEIGMSGGPILNAQGWLVGVNGRRPNRDPAFGAYVFEDGSQPSSAMLEQMLPLSWGIPISPDVLSSFP